MSKIGSDGVPYNGRTGNATQQPTTSIEPAPGTVTEPAAELAPGEEGRPAGRVARAFQSARSWRSAALSLLALACTIIILTAGVALVGALLWPKTYAARAEVLFPITQEQPTGFLREDRNMTTQLVLMRGQRILGPIAVQQGREVIDLQDDITVSVLDSSEIIQLEVRDRSEQRALQTAQAVLAGYLEFSQSGQPSLRERTEAELAAANVALTNAQQQLDVQQKSTAAAANADLMASLQRTVQTQQIRQQQLQAQLDSVNLTPVAQQLTAPYSVGAVRPQPLIAAVTGALVGVLLAACVIVVVARSWTRTKG